MWSPLNSIFRVKYNPNCSYDENPILSTLNTSEAWKLSLDEVSVAGRFDPAYLPYDGPEWLSHAVRTLLSPEPPISIPDRVKGLRTDERYFTHCQKLTHYGVCSTLHEEPKFVSSYFAIPKKDDTARSIFNGARLST